MIEQRDEERWELVQQIMKRHKQLSNHVRYRVTMVRIRTANEIGKGIDQSNNHSVAGERVC